MDAAVPLSYICHIDPEDMEQSDDLPKMYMGPAHVIDDVHNFPSISQVINESKLQTGVYVPDKYCQDFDEKWHQSLRHMFGRDPKFQEQLQEFLSNNGLSNGRPLQLQVMSLPPTTYFKIHAHPNIEFELTLKGCLEEFRFLFHVPKEDLAGNNNNNNSGGKSPPALRGPNITKEHVFQHVRVEAGKCMINEVGSVHQSFTGHHGPCVLIVLWSGCHANVRPDQVEQGVDRKLKPEAGW
jgi:hypothetical protein